jgi:hypothetical protein
MNGSQMLPFLSFQYHLAAAGVQFPLGTGNFSLHHHVQNDQSVKLTFHLNLIPRLRMHRFTSTTPMHYHSMVIHKPLFYVMTDTSVECIYDLELSWQLNSVNSSQGSLKMTKMVLEMSVSYRHLTRLVA